MISSFLLLHLVLLYSFCVYSRPSEELLGLIRAREQAVYSICSTIRDYYSTPRTRTCDYLDSCSGSLGADFAAAGVDDYTCKAGWGRDTTCGDGTTCTNDHTMLSFERATMLWSFGTKVVSDAIDAFSCAPPVLSEAFRANLPSEVELQKSWQYFGTPMGALSLYPGRSFLYTLRLNDSCKVFNDECPRFYVWGRGWYIAAATGPKDVVVLLDASPSMLRHRRLLSVKEATNQVLDGLGVHDHIQVVWFHPDTNTAESCPCNGGKFVNVTSVEDFQCLRDCVNAIHVHAGRRTAEEGDAEGFREGFREAFDIILGSPFAEEPHEHRLVNTIILFVSDGGTLESDMLLEYISSRNAIDSAEEADYATRIATYSLGPDANDDLMQKIACANHGIWTPVEDDAPDFLYAEIRRYYEFFLIRSPQTQVLESAPIQWTEAYDDFGDLGRMTTAAMACFSEDGKDFYGVAGIDVTMNEFEPLLSNGSTFRAEVGPIIWNRSRWSTELAEISEEELEARRVYHKCNAFEEPESDDSSLPWSLIIGLGGGLACCVLYICSLAWIFVVMWMCASRTGSGEETVRKGKDLWKALIDESAPASGAGQRRGRGGRGGKHVPESSFAKRATIKVNLALFEISSKDIQLKSQFARGGSEAVLYKAKWLGKTVAVKMFQTRHVADDIDDFRDFEKEVEFLSSLNHPNVLQLFGVTTQPPRVGIVMEFCELGDLVTYLVEKAGEGTPVEMPTKLGILREVVQGMRYIHDRDIIHRDLKTANCLVTRELVIKIGDFGIATAKSSQHKTKRIGTQAYMAPEVALGLAYSSKADMFAHLDPDSFLFFSRSYGFSIIIHDVLTEDFWSFAHGGRKGRMPDFRLELKVANDPTFRPFSYKKNIEEYPPWLVKIMKMSWQHDPESRPTFHDIADVFEQNGIGRDDEYGSFREAVVLPRPGSVRLEDLGMKDFEEDWNGEDADADADAGELSGSGAVAFSERDESDSGDDETMELDL